MSQGSSRYRGARSDCSTTRTASDGTALVAISWLGQQSQQEEKERQGQGSEALPHLRTLRSLWLPRHLADIQLIRLLSILHPDCLKFCGGTAVGAKLRRDRARGGGGGGGAVPPLRPRAARCPEPTDRLVSTREPALCPAPTSGNPLKAELLHPTPDSQPGVGSAKTDKTERNLGLWRHRNPRGQAVAPEE